MGIRNSGISREILTFWYCSVSLLRLCMKMFTPILEQRDSLMLGMRRAPFLSFFAGNL